MSNDPRQQLNRAMARAYHARDALSAQLDATRYRVSPQRLKQDAIDAGKDLARDTRDTSVDAVRRYPVSSAALGLAALAYVFRRPLLDRAPALLDRVADRLDDLEHIVRGRV